MAIHQRRGMTLIEVVAGIVLLGTILTTTILAQARVLRQHQLALIKLKAVDAIDQLLTAWIVRGNGVPRDSEGILLSDPNVRWKTTTKESRGTRPLTVSIVELTAVAENDPAGMLPLVRVELAVPPGEAP